MNTFDSKTFLKTLTHRPGVYQMFDAEGKILYVGKARDLKDRLSSYFRSAIVDIKTQLLVQQIADIKVLITASENEALLLESNLIKSLMPRFNILLKDDKSYPYLFLSAHPFFPRLDYHRGAQREKGEYFGPYPNARAVHATLDLLQKIFKIRQCSDNFFNSRTRPCLQYQIKRCTAPCVGYIDPGSYQEYVQRTRLFLQGKNDEILQELTEKMERAAEALEFEQAAQYRDQLVSMRHIQERQYINAKEGDVDVIAVATHPEVTHKTCVEVLSIRGGRLLGSKSYFPKVPGMFWSADILSAFLPQYYLSGKRGTSLPQRILISAALHDQNWIQAALSEQLQKNIFITEPKRGNGRRWLQMALANAQQALLGHVAAQNHYYQWLEALQKALHLPNLPQRIECFDISHTLGEATVASCVVFGNEGPIRAEYRRFNIKNVTPGDDYAAMQQALMRRYTRIKADGAPLPDIILIDGGKGQLSQAISVLEILQISGVTLVGVAKGPERKPGLETLFVAGNPTPLPLPADSVALHLIQRIRDEAHRFAITGHRQQRAKARSTSRLEDISGVGPKRRQALLKHFGGLQGVLKASVEELARAAGINIDLAQRIYDQVHGK